MTRPSFSPLASRSGLVDASGRPVVAGRELARGGEGTVYQIHGRPDLVAKVYERPVRPEKAEKLEWMVANSPDRLRAVSAWPVDLLLDATSRRVTGFLMPRVQESFELHQFFSPAERKRRFPGATFGFLARVARNLAAAVDEVHASGHVVGDVNQKGFLVSADSARVTLIDCDSFQIRTGSCTYRCDVGVAEFTPPELLGQDFRSIDRTPSHDAFGLAVLIFQLLLMGRHPYAGRFLSGEDGTLERAIREHRFADSANALALGVAPPRNSAGLGILTQRLARLFEAAFSPHASQSGRPPAGAWIAALDELFGSLRACTRRTTHVYLEGLGECPWCGFETRGIRWFLPRIERRLPFDLILVRQRLASLQVDSEQLIRAARTAPIFPPTGLAFPVSVARALDIKRGFGGGRLTIVSTIVFVLVFTLLGSVPAAVISVLVLVGIRRILLAPVARHREQLEEELESTQQRLDDIIRDFSRFQPGAPLKRLRRCVEARLAERARLPERHRARLQQATKEALDELLARFPISGAGIRGVGGTSLAALRSHGIETAADVDDVALSHVPGIGPARRAALLSWRRELEKRCLPSVPPERLEELCERARLSTGEEGRKLEDRILEALESAEAAFEAIKTEIDLRTSSILELRWRITELEAALGELDD